MNRIGECCAVYIKTLKEKESFQVPSLGWHFYDARKSLFYFVIPNSVVVGWRLKKHEIVIYDGKFDEQNLCVHDRDRQKKWWERLQNCCKENKISLMNFSHVTYINS